VSWLATELCVQVDEEGPKEYESLLLTLEEALEWWCLCLCLYVE
jgi:hypothetical protein